MKNIRDIQLHSDEKSFEKKFAVIRALLKIKLMLPPRFREAVLFMYVKNKTLFFALNHPGLVMEFNYNLGLIKDLLKKFDFSALGEVRDVKCFASHKARQREEAVEESYTYTEHAEGVFENHITDSKLHDKLEEIRSVICSKTS